MSLRTDEQGRPIRALGLTSGGLDSLLASAFIRAQGIEVLALTFVSPFLSPDKARRGVERLGLPWRVIDFTAPHIEVVKNPRFGRGANMNPCLDCHALMIRLADEIRCREGFHFIFTGEVLGQRPMSQTRAGLDLVARASGAGDYLLRPLSAKHLAPTEPERRGWVDREALLDFHGRSRKAQMALAPSYGLTEYPTPAGGCPLTEPQFSRRLKHLLTIRPEAGPREMALLRFGRHFALGGQVRLIVGRHQRDNEQLNALVSEEDFILKAAQAPGPLGLIPAPVRPDEKQLRLAGRIVLSYADAKPPRAFVEITGAQGFRVLELAVEPKEFFQEMMVV